MQKIASPATSPQNFSAIFALPCCKLGLTETDKALKIIFLPPDTPILPPSTELAQKLQTELNLYLSNPAHLFNFPHAPQGTAFQQRVWEQISAIACGQTASYKTLAERLRSAPRAVGQACAANPLPLVVPCHRVVSSSGLGGFAHATEGWLIATKRWLIEHENAGNE